MFQDLCDMIARANRRAFTLLDVMITITVIGILAAVALPLVNTHLEKTKDAAARATYSHVRKALDMYFQQHLTWPAEINPALFVNAEPVELPDGYQISYRPKSGDLELLTGIAVGAPDIVVVAE